jgi:hypothetical protein
MAAGTAEAGAAGFDDAAGAVGAPGLDASAACRQPIDRKHAVTANVALRTISLRIVMIP